MRFFTTADGLLGPPQIFRRRWHYRSQGWGTPPQPRGVWIYFCERISFPCFGPRRGGLQSFCCRGAMAYRLFVSKQSGCAAQPLCLLGGNMAAILVLRDPSRCQMTRGYQWQSGTIAKSPNGHHYHRNHQRGRRGPHVFLVSYGFLSP